MVESRIYWSKCFNCIRAALDILTLLAVELRAEAIRPSSEAAFDQKGSSDMGEPRAEVVEKGNQGRLANRRTSGPRVIWSQGCMIFTTRTPDSLLER